VDRKYLTTFIVFTFLFASCDAWQNETRSFRGGHTSYDNEDLLPKDESPHHNDEGKGQDEPLGLSHRESVHFKRQDVFANDIANALDLDRASLCLEFGELSCIDKVHHLALGGTDAYERNVYAPLSETSASTPIVVERVLLSACQQRAERDIDRGEQVIFSRLAAESNLAQQLKPSIESLYQRALLRNPSSQELAVLTGLYREISELSPQKAQRDWAMAACYAVLSSVEFMFY